MQKVIKISPLVCLVLIAISTNTSGHLEQKFYQWDYSFNRASERVDIPKDIHTLLNDQKIISKNVGQTAEAANTFSGRKAEKADAEANRAEAQGDHETAERKRNEAQSWQTGGENKRKVDTAVAVVGAILAGKTTAQTAVAAISPELNAQIHEITKDSKLANILAHATLSATEFYAAGLDPMAGALAGAAGEGSAMLLAEKVFNKKPADLTAGEKELLKVASQLAGAVVGGISGDSLATATEGAETAKRAVENNLLAAEIRRQEEEHFYLNLFDDEKKAAEFLAGVREGESEAIINDIKDNVKGVINLVTSPIETVQQAAKSLGTLFSNIDKVGEAVELSVTEWQLLYEKALETDPKLAGKMLGELKGHLDGTALPTQLTLSATSLKGIKALADNTGKLFLGKGTLSNKDIGIGWGQIDKQGKPWEAYLQKTLPKGTIDLNTIKPNFKTFDHLLPDGTAISAKTLNTKTASYTNNPKRITAQLNKYVDDMVKFKGDRKKGGEIISSRDISSREMYLAIPSGSTKQQMEAVNKSLDYAKSQGVKIIVKEVK